jgi:hypothetical protein
MGRQRLEISCTVDERGCAGLERLLRRVEPVRGAREPLDDYSSSLAVEL